jgi:hypothetical protein
MLNLLPDSQKHALATHLLYEQIRQVGLTVLSIGLVLSGAMLTADRLLHGWYNDLRNESSVQVTELDRQTLATLVTDVSQTSNTIIEIQGDWLHPLADLQLLLANTPSDMITLNKIEISRATSEIDLSGVAQSREALINYQHTLETIPRLTQINFPLNDLSQRDQINFTASAILTYEVSTN